MAKTTSKEKLLLFILILIAAPPLHAAPRLDLDADLGLRWLSYSNLNYTNPTSGSQSFLEHSFKMGLDLSRLALNQDDIATLEVGFSLSAYGIAGSTQPVAAPFDRAASRFPTTGLSPFVSSAFVTVHRSWGGAWDFTLGRVPFKLGSGLILDDDETGFTGAVAQRRLPGENLIQFFAFEPQAQPSARGSLDVYGLSFRSPGVDGDWDFNELYENNRVQSQELGRPVSAVNRSFSSAHYAMKSDMVSFEGEGAFEYGAAKASQAGTSNVTFMGGAVQLKASWKQPLLGGYLGEGKFYFGRATGDKPSTPNRDEAFFPSVGHRFDGLQRSGVGDFFAATVYDAQGSSGSATGLPDGVSGLQYYGLGFTFPPYNDILFDADYYVFSAQRTLSGGKALGQEIDLSARYVLIKDQLRLKLSAAFFTAGAALSPASSSSHRIAAVVSGKF